jgi:hypothetical protein
MYAILGMILTFVGSAFLTLLFINLFVPPIVRAIGERHFVELSGLEPMGYAAPLALIIAVVCPLIEHKYGFGPALWVLPISSLLACAYAVSCLWVSKGEHPQREFEIGDSIVRVADNVTLQPHYVMHDSHYHDMNGMGTGYSYYYLTLHDENGALAKNSYLHKSEQETDLWQVLEVANKTHPCRAMPFLLFVWREAPLKWLEAVLLPDNAPVLCGSLSELSEESRAWWRQWLFPDFPADGLAEASRQEIGMRFGELRQAYSEAFSIGNTSSFFQQFLERAGDQIQIMTYKRYEMLAFEAAPNGGTFSGSREDPILKELIPR